MEEKKEPIIVDNLLFAISYPESYSLIKKYYDTLAKTCLDSKRFMKFDGEKFSPFQQKGNNYVLDKIKQVAQSTYTMYKPLFKDDDYLIVHGGFNEREIYNINSKYRLLKIGENDSLRDKKLALEIYNLLLNSNYTLEKICEKYKTTDKRIHRILKENLSTEDYRVVLNTLKKNTLDRYYLIQDKINRLYDLIPNGITMDDNTKTSFTMIDYYTITSLNPSTIIREMEQRKPRSKKEAIARAISKKYLNTHKNQGPFINKNKLLERKLVIIIDNQEYYIKDYADELFTIFKDNNIPTYSNLLETAFSRIVRNQVVIPLKNNNEKKRQYKKAYKPFFNNYIYLLFQNNFPW